MKRRIGVTLTRTLLHGSLCALLGAASVSVAAPPPEQVQLQVRYRSPRARSATIDPWAAYTLPISGWLSTELAGRASLGAGSAESVDYGMETRAYYLPGAFVALRLLQVNRLADGVAYTQLSLRTEARLRIARFLSATLGGGWHERFVSLEPSLPIPGFSRISYRDHDFAVKAGLSAELSDSWASDVEIGTIDVMDVFNLNSPFAELRVEHRPSGEPWALMALARYRLLLGFGRLGELAFGVGLKLDLSPPFSSGS